ncbi:unnamed protein product [Periconia digitata]|uniref:C2H2-type domain-containing protein n=1 Tax=Periconia digitata TaxID=1303443 RepID=A0A9W4XXK8_9PLEO|nr:unnamed protein product [Periconia digitata]
MLTLPQRRQHLAHHHPSTTTTPSAATSTTNLPSPLSPQTFSLDTLTQQLSAQQAQQYADQKLLNDYLESQQTSFNPQLVLDSNTSNPFMPGAYDFANPQIRIQQSTPVPHPGAAFSSSPMLSATAATGLDSWPNSYNSNVQGSQTLQTPQQQSRSERSHNRAPSSSSVASTNYQTFPNSTSNHLPTPTHTPTQDSFMNNNNSFNNTYTSQAGNMDSTMAAHMSMKQALMDQHVPDDDVPAFAHSARHSVSSYGHDSPATPHTAQDDMDFKIPPNDVRPVPKFERTYTDVAADYSFDPNAIIPQTASIPNKSSSNALLSPYHSNKNDLIQRSLQAAQIARSQSPSSSASRGDSPFRRGSPYRQPSSNNTFSSPRMAVSTAAAAREQKQAADAAHAMKSQLSSSEDSQVKTISPKDALLDYRDADNDSKVPLFPEGGATEYDQQYNGGDRFRNTATQSGFDTTSQSFRRDNWATPQFSPNFPPAVSATSQPASTFAFATPSIQNNMHSVQSNPTSQYRSVSSQMSFGPDSTPEFPAHLTSMESSCSEAGGDPSSQSSDRPVSHSLQKPADSKADSGTYTCTYHGCTQRFETPQKLQKHKREGHRNTANIGMGTSASSSTSAAGMTSAALLERNSQAGPHKCERINPTTGKPCNTIFSRPYDLTRHEDTIHNVRKQKVRCALCVEEKTFSRNDALTRHMRVVHPEVDFPGKHRRRGGNHD